MSFVRPFRQSNATVLALAATATMALLWSCSSTDPANTTPSSVTPAPGSDNQTAAPGTAVVTAPSVTISNSEGVALSDVSVTFAVATGGGSVTPSTVTTGAQGVATVTSWTLGTTAGSNSMTATAGDTEFTFTATGTTSFNMTTEQGNDQTGSLTGPLPIDPTVLVTDQGTGNPVSGVVVDFTPRAGDGSVLSSLQATTDANGEASITWQPGRNGSNFIDVTAGSASTQLFAIGSNSAYHMELRFLSPINTTMIHKETFGDAAARWMSVIVGDTQGADLTNNPFPAGQCFGMPHPEVTDIIEDLIIYVDLTPIDGPGAVLGFAGPCGRFVGARIPIIGGMTFDTSDLNTLIANGTFSDVILHEMGHVVGIGTLWDTGDLPSLLTNPSCPSSPGADTHFTGANGLVEFATIAGGPWTGTAPTTSPVPVENASSSGCPGTRDGHWRETSMGTELMTGFISSASNPMSRTTIASVRDLSYVVDLGQADPYTLFSTTNLRSLTEGGVRMVDDIARGSTVLFLPGGGHRIEIIK